MVGRRSFDFGKVSIFRCVLASFREGKLPGICSFFQLPPKRLKDGRVTEATCFVGPKEHHHPSQWFAPVGTSTYHQSGIATCATMPAADAQMLVQ